MSWATLQLAEFVAAVSSREDVAAAKQAAVERAAEAFDADAAALVEEGVVVAALGFPAGSVPTAEFVAVAGQKTATLELPDIGECGAMSTAIAGTGSGESHIVLAWRDRSALDAEEAALLSGMVRVLGLSVRELEVVEELRERRLLLERLSRIQRSISRSATAAEVFDAITEGASKLLRDEIVGIRLLDPDDRSQTTLASITGVSDETRREIERRPVGRGITGRAIVEGRLIATDDYQHHGLADGVLAQEGVQSAMAAPIFEEGWVVGALVVATRETGRTHSQVEREIVLSFAEHASLVLSATRAVEESRERALESKEKRFRSLVQTSAELIVVLDSEHRIEYQSPSVGRVLGYGPDALVGHPLRELVAPEDCDRVEEFLNAALATAGVSSAIEWRWRHHDGFDVEAETVANNLLGDPSVRGVVLTARDLTERRREERERRRLTEQLEQAQRLEGIGQLAGGIAHDFSNLLAVILNYAEFLQDALPDDPMLREDLDQIRVAADRGAQLVQQLLAFSRRDMVSPEVVEIAAAIAETEGMLERTLGEHYTLRTNVEESLPPIRIDPGKLGQVLVNLVVNARDAMPDGGQIEIDADAAEIDDLHAESRVGIPAGGYVRLVVRDHGCGMEPETATHAFEPFFTTKGKGEGTGLGLAMVYGIVTQAGGYVDLDSVPGHGTVISLFLPAIASPDLAEAEPAALEPAAGNGRAVLVVEDEPAVRALTQRILARHGYSVLEAADGPAALELCRLHGDSIDLLLTDVVMPTMSGKELAELATDHCPHLPVLFMSGYTDDVVSSQGVADGTLRLLQKPFDPEALLQAVDSALAEDSSAAH